MLGASRSEQLVQNLDAIDLAGQLDEGTWKRVEAATN